jgi:hypothetical protein
VRAILPKSPAIQVDRVRAVKASASAAILARTIVGIAPDVVAAVILTGVVIFAGIIAGIIVVAMIFSPLGLSVSLKHFGRGFAGHGRTFRIRTLHEPVAPLHEPRTGSLLSASQGSPPVRRAHREL